MSARRPVLIEFLLEIQTEEMPSSHVKTALIQLQKKFEGELMASEIRVKEIKTFGTCRRLVVLSYFSPRQEDREEEVIGPPKSIAFTSDGSPTQAARGFAKSQGVALNRLQVLNTEKGEYLGLKKIKKGKSSHDILRQLVPRIISSLAFPKMMKWGENSFKFSRPINNLFCLFGGKILSFTVGGISSSNTTRGHKIYFPHKIKARSFREYVESLEKKKVILKQEKRRKMILDQIEKRLAPLKVKLYPDEELLEELVYNVEHPYVFMGSFPEKYLNLPIEVLSTAMKEGQKLFSVVKGSKQVTYFLGVADALNDSKSLIRKGNERVLKARLEDARFFWEEDLKKPLSKRVEDLKYIVFQEKLGSYMDKTMRLKKICAYLADKIEDIETKKELVQAAELCKTDLLTEMVREFPSLQGKMGGLYTKAEGYPPTVWKSIYEHYKPEGLDDTSSLTLGGAVLSIADKMDSIVGAVGAGIRVTGSKDPFGLRRLAHGVCKIILEKKLCFSFDRLIDKILKIYDEKLEKYKKEVKDYCLIFFQNRLQYIYERQGYRYDLVKASLFVGIENIYYSYLRLKALDSLKSSPQFEPLILIAKRVNNIIHNQPVYRVRPDLFQEKEERELYTSFTIIKENILPMISSGDFAQAQKIILRIRTSINKFFDEVLVMTEEKKLRQNRLALLQEISKLLRRVADYSQVVIEG